MPFKSLKQSKACYATHGFGNKINCDEWAKATNYNNMKKMGGKMKGCMKCGGRMQAGGYHLPCPPGYTTDETGQCIEDNNYNPAQEMQKGMPGTGIAGKTGDGTGVNPDKKWPQKHHDPFFTGMIGNALSGATTGLEWLSGIVDRNRQNQYMQNQFSTLGQKDGMPVSNYQPNPFSLYAKYGGKVKHAGKIRHNKKKDPDMDEMGGVDLDKDGDMMAKGGRFMGINPAHKGFCTPMSKATCTGHRRALALTLKKHHGFHD